MRADPQVAPAWEPQPWMKDPEDIEASYRQLCTDPRFVSWLQYLNRRVKGVEMNWGVRQIPITQGEGACVTLRWDGHDRWTLRHSNGDTEVEISDEFAALFVAEWLSQTAPQVYGHDMRYRWIQTAAEHCVLRVARRAEATAAPKPAAKPAA